MKRYLSLALIGFILGYLVLYTILYITKVEYYYLYSLILGGILALGGLIIAKFVKPSSIIYDNQEVFRFPITPNYYRKSMQEFKGVKNLVMISLLVALMLLSKLLTLPSGFGALGIGVTYIFFAIVSLLYGPAVGMVVGLLVDTLDFLIFPTGFPYFPGYTLNSVLTGLIYGLFFYRTKLSFLKVLGSRFIINIGINAILGSLWWGIISNFHSFEQYFTYFLVIALPKNVCYLIPQAVLLFLVVKALAPIFVRAKALPLMVGQNIKWL